MRAAEGGLPKFGKKIAKFHSRKWWFHGEMADFQITRKNSSGKFFQMKIAHPWSTLSSAIHCDPFQCFCWAHFFRHIVVFCQCGLRTQNVLENLVTLEGWVILPVKSHWTMNISANFCLTAKSFGCFENNFWDLHWTLLSIFDSSRAICAFLWGQNQLLVPSGWGKARNHSNFPDMSRRNPSRGCLESIKSAGKRSQKVGIIICPRHFLETLISCRVYILKNAIL